jgi:hypothetical protein
MVIRGIRLQMWTRVIVNSCIGKIIAGDLSLVASRLYRMAVTRPLSRAAVTVGRICSGFVMVVQASGLDMGLGRLSRLLRGVGVLAMLDSRLDKPRRFESVCEVPGVQRLLESGMAVRVIIDCQCEMDRVEVTS